MFRFIKNKNFTYTQISTASFLIIILLGAALLSLPISSKTREWTPFIDSLFTSASATCVTGLVIYDTFSHFSYFGQTIIICLIQVGGLGFMIIATLFSFLLRRKIGLKERGLLQECVSTISIGGIVRLTRHILLGTVLFESIGAVLLSIRFCRDMGFIKGVLNGIFHSVSAFCNAGFDLMGKFESGSSLTHYSSDVIVNMVIMILIIIGGIGFFVWEDILTNKFKFNKYRLHTKIVLIVTFCLLSLGAVLFYILEKDRVFSNMNGTDKILASLFQSISPRTAGFNTVNIADLSDGSILLTIILMFIGGSPGSTAGGIKTTAFFIVLLSVFSSIRNKQDLNIFDRRLEDSAVRQAYNIITIYVICATLGTLILCGLQPFGLKEVLFEVISALSTVGLTTGITSKLCTFSKIIITLLMFIGRVGGLSVALAFSRKKEYLPIRKPVEKISI